MTFDGIHKIAFVEVAWPDLGSEYRVQSALARAACDREDDLEVLSLSHPTLAQLADGVVRRIPVRWRSSRSGLVGKVNSVVRLPRALRTAVGVCRNEAPDVIYCSQQRRDVIFAAAISRMTGIPYVVHLHYVFGPWLGRLTYRLIRSARHIIAVSEFVRESCLLRGIDSERVTTVHNTMPAIESTPSREDARLMLGVSPSAPLIACVARLDRHKGQLQLIEAVARVRESIPDVVVLIVGGPGHDRGYEGLLRQRCAELGLGSSVQFLGFRRDIPEILSAADLFALPTQMEAFGVVFIEAMRFALPVVAVASGGVPEVVQDGVTGLLSGPDDDDAFDANLRALLSDRDAARQMGMLGRQRLDSHFSLAPASERWAAALAHALAPPLVR